MLRCEGGARASKHAPTRSKAHADAEARLARRIRAWAGTWRRCPLKRCRRLGACSREAACCGITPGPVTFSDAARQAIRHALDRVAGPRPPYDGDARERG